MGIPLYFKIISDKYPNIIINNIDNDKNNNLFLDLNCAIHPCAHKVLENYCIVISGIMESNIKTIEWEIIKKT